MPLSYVIIKDTPSPDDRKNWGVKIIYQASLVENMFTRDSRKVINILKKLNLGTDSKTWINGIKCARKSIQEIQPHYDGMSEGTQSKQVVKYYLRKIFYNKETTFTFENHVTKIKGIFNVLEKYGVPIYEDWMAEHLLD